ncbi:MAG: NosD domain-containing protein, partial [Candidatus Paceibacterota bacterium]
MKKRFLELPIHHRIFFATLALSMLSVGTFTGIFYAQKAFTSPAPSIPANFRMPTDPFQRKGETSGIGTHFTITDSEYLNIVLDSTKTVDLKLTSIPKVITMMFATTTAATTQITLSGLLKNTTYYKYEDDYHHLAQFTSDDNGSYTYMQDISARHLVFIQTRKSTKFISDTGGDCSTIGTWNQSTKTCTLNQDISETVQIDGNNITLDGNGHAIIGDAPYVSFTGVLFAYRTTGNTVKNLNIANFTYGIYVDSSGNTISKTTERNNYEGIHLSGSGYGNTLSGNTASNNEGAGIVISSGNTLSGNTTSDNKGYGIAISGVNNTLTNNIAQENDYFDVFAYFECENTVLNTTGSGGRPIKYYKSAVNLRNETLSELILCNADHSVINNVAIDGSAAKNNNGLILVHTDFSTIENVNSSGNESGITLFFSGHNTLSANALSSNNIGIEFYSSVNNSITDNIAANNLGEGVYLYGDSDNNILSGNTVSGNSLGILLNDVNNNQVYKNNVINNSMQAHVGSGDGNVFNLPKPIGGNSWSDYDTLEKGCDDQNSDGFCDAPFVFTGGRDNLPRSGRAVTVAVILAELSDAPHKSGSITEQPCKLIPSKTYPNGHDKSYYDDMMYCVTDYYRENSYGTVNIVPIVFPTWYKLTKPTREYVGKEDQLAQDAIAKSGINLSGVDAVDVINSQTVGKLNTVTYSSLPIWGNSPPNKITVSEYKQVGAHAHEIGHALGEILIEGGDKTLVPDLYNMGLYSGNLDMTSYGEGRWDLMATGDRNGGLSNFGKDFGKDPALMSSYTKEFLKLLTYNIKPKSFHGDFIIPALNQKPLGGSIFRYNLQENTNDDSTTPYYILETRKKDLPDKKWDTSILKDALVAYYVNPLGFQKYGNILNSEGEYYRPNNCRTLNIPKGGVMSIGDTYNDYDNLVAFSALSETNLNGKYLINARIKHIDKESFSYKFYSVFLHPTSKFNVSHCTGETGSVASGSPDDSILYVFVLAIRLGIILLALSMLFFALYYRYRKQWALNPLVRKSLIILFTLIGILSAALIAFVFYVLSNIGYDLRDAGKRVFDVNYHDPFDIGEPHDGSFAYASSLTPTTLPDLDLHAITPDGKHVGVNYQTGEYENQIAGAIPSGDNQ